jgi:hypothetical protein
MIDKHRYQEAYYDSCDKNDDKVFEGKRFKKLFEISIFPKIPSQKSK